MERDVNGTKRDTLCVRLDQLIAPSNGFKIRMLLFFNSLNDDLEHLFELMLFSTTTKKKVRSITLLNKKNSRTLVANELYVIKFLKLTASLFNHNL